MLCIRAPTLFVLTDWLWTYPFGHIAVTYCLPPSYRRNLLSPCERVKFNSGLFRWTYCYALLCRLCSFGHIAVLILMRLNPQFVCCIFYSVYFLKIQSFILFAITILAICLFFSGALGEIRTPDTCVRSAKLLSTELQGHFNVVNYVRKFTDVDIFYILKNSIFIFIKTIFFHRFKRIIFKYIVYRKNNTIFYIQSCSCI